MFLPSISTKWRVIQVLAVMLLMAASWQTALSQSAIERLVSPGKLSSAHIEQEKDCASCHESFNKKAQSGLCADCHKEIRADISSAAGFHGKSPDASKAECKSCHTEHVGRSADIRGLEPETFNHEFTDYPLSGAHNQVDCAGCHKPGIAFAKAPRDCVGCHKPDDPHFGKLGAACADCHVVSSWKSIRFDHAKTDFPLLGKHESTSCMSCHKLQVWAGTSSKCIDCHRSDDVHKGSFGAGCESCHNAGSWTQTRFNHDTTGFKLLGRHSSIECAACHGPGKPSPAPETCVGCHREDDVHKGANGSACADCHTPKNWKTVLFDHSKTGFALLGSHGKAPCVSCHTKPASEWKPPQSCSGCHGADDTHKGLLGSDCATCHSETSWAKIHFDHDTDAGFILGGAHAKTACATCHKQPTPVASPPVSCAGCHKQDDPHLGQLGDGCGQCHGDLSWTAGVRFDHEFTSFPLLGAHKGAVCADCHKSRAYLDVSVSCVGCHSNDDIHEGRMGKDCAQCHNPSDWKRWKFDHDRQTTFSLTGAHKELACASCHTSKSSQSMEISARCISCHAPDDKHNGSFGNSCERCHNTEAFWAVDISN